MNLECTMLGKINYIEKYEYCMILYIYMCGILGGGMNSKKQSILVTAWGWGNGEMLVKGYELPVIRGISNGDLIYNWVTIISNTV